MKYEYVIWDLDGTLLDTSSGIEKSIDYTVNMMGLKNYPGKQKKKL